MDEMTDDEVDESLTPFFAKVDADYVKAMPALVKAFKAKGPPDDDETTTVVKGKDASGHEHKGPGEGGGQFTASGSGGKKASGQSGGKTMSKQKSDISTAIRPATPEDLNSDHIHLWHGTSLKAAKKIIEVGKLKEGQRGLNAAANPLSASQYPEDTGAQVLFLLRADPKDLQVDPNDQEGETVEEGLFPDRPSASSATAKKSQIVAAFDIENADDPDAAIKALNEGDLDAAMKAGAKLIYEA